MDPLAEKHYNESPYVYCSDNPVKYIDPNGKEKIICYNTNDPNIQGAKAYNTERNVINIYAHGNSQEISVWVSVKGTDQKKELLIRNGADMDRFLKANSKVWNNKKDGDNITIVLHSCETAKEDDVNQNSVARQISKDLKNTTIIAPNEVIGFNENKELGVMKVKEEGDGENKKITKVGDGSWIKLENGKTKNTYPGNTKQGSTNTDEKF